MAKRALTQFPREAKRRLGASTKYRDVYNAAVDGKISAEQGPNGRWTYDDEDLPQIAAALGLVPSNAAVAA